MLTKTKASDGKSKDSNGKPNDSIGKISWILDDGHGKDTPGKRSSILTQNGFYTNREQFEYLLDPAWRSVLITSGNTC
jgi:hypothetical protein